jgi:UDP-N-acetyl-D-mannosaminuronic acid transferase (WecB/TagA/CpsF family)
MTVAAIDPPPFPRRNILGVEISVARQREAIEFLLARLAARIPTRVAFANANLLTTLSSQPGGTRLLDGFLVLNDGIAVDVASLVLYRSWFPQNLNGTDLVPAPLAAAPRGHEALPLRSETRCGRQDRRAPGGALLLHPFAGRSSGVLKQARRRRPRMIPP